MTLSEQTPIRHEDLSNAWDPLTTEQLGHFAGFHKTPLYPPVRRHLDRGVARCLAVMQNTKASLEEIRQAQAELGVFRELIDLFERDAVRAYEERRRKEHPE